MVATFFKYRMKIRLLLAGWRPNRDVWHTMVLPDWVAPNTTAKKILSEFGNLKFGSQNDGGLHVKLNPLCAEVFKEQVICFARALRTTLYPIGSMEIQDEEIILVNEAGNLFCLIENPRSPECIQYNLEALAASFEDALPYLLFSRIGVGRQRMRDGLRAIELYDKAWILRQNNTTGEVIREVVECVASDI